MEYRGISRTKWFYNVNDPSTHAYALECVFFFLLRKQSKAYWFYKEYSGLLSFIELNYDIAFTMNIFH